jgi:hypothetical protein
MHRQFPDSPLFTAATDSSPSGLAVASLLQWRGAHHFPAHIRAEVKHVTRLARKPGVIAWRTLVAIEAKAAAGGCFTSPRRRAGDASPRLWKALKRTAVGLGLAPCLRRRWILAGLDNVGTPIYAHAPLHDEANFSLCAVVCAVRVRVRVCVRVRACLFVVCAVMRVRGLDTAQVRRR